MSQLFKSRSSPAKLSEKDLGESLRTAVIQNEAHHVRALLKKISVDYVLDANRKTALYLASQHGHFKLVKTLLSRGANPNYRCVDGSTPVHAACYAANLEIMSLLINAGGDLRLHDNDGRGVKEWALKHIDKKKSRTMICFIEELYHKVMETKEDGESLGTPSNTSSQKKKLKYPTNSRNSVCLQNIGFGRVASWSEEQVSEPSLIPVITETALVHDQLGISFTNGPFMVMESMYWNQLITVTVKRLRKIPMEQESGRVDELINENNYMLRLKHANILLLLAVCPVDRFENVVLIYERVERGSLHTLLHHADVRFPRTSTCSIFIQICDAVLYLHESNLIHSYISAHAIMIMSSSHNAKLTNFEYMVDSDASDTSVPVNRVYPSAATNWLAPEILVDKRVSRKTDNYGICVVLWEVLHGKLPFADLSASEIEILMMDAQNRVLPIDFSIEAPLNMILDSGLKCDPSQRSCKIKDIQNLLEHTYVAVKSDEPLKLYKKQAKSGFFEALSVQCKLGCLLYSDENGDLAELPKTGHNRDLVEQREWRNKSGRGMLEQREPSLTDFNLEDDPEALRHNMRLQKIPAVRKLFRDYAGHDESAEHGKAHVSGNELGKRLLLLKRAQTVGGESIALAANDGDLAEADGVISAKAQAQDEQWKDQDLALTASEQSGTDIKQPSGERANAVLDVSGASDVQAEIKENVPDTDESSVTDIQTDSEDGVTDVAETKLAAKPTDNEGEVTDGGEGEHTVEKTETEEAIATNVENILTLGPERQSREQPLDALNISQSDAPMFFAAPENRQTKNLPSSFSGADVISTDQVPSFPVSEELIVPVIFPAKKILCTFPKDGEESFKGSATSAAVGSVDLKNSQEVERSDSSQHTGFHVRRSIQLLRRAFFSNSNLTDGPDPVSSASAMMTAQAKRSSSDVSLQWLKHPSATANKELQAVMKASKPEQPVAASSADDQLLAKLSGEMMANSIEKFKAFIEKPLPPLPRTYIKQTQGQKQKAAADSVCTASEFDSADWQRISYRAKGGTTPLWFPCGRETRTGYNACVTSRAFGQYVPTAASHSGHSERPQSGSAANLSQQRLGSSSHRVREVVQPKTESPVFLYNQVGLYATHVGASKTCDKTLVERRCQSPPARNVDFMTGFKPASHHVPSMVAPHLSKRMTESLIATASIMPQQMQHRLCLQQEGLTGSFIGYNLGQDLHSSIRKGVPLSENDSLLREVLAGRLEKKITADMEERALNDVELKNDPAAGSKGMSSVAETTFPKLSALSAQMFRRHLGSDGPRAAVRSAQVISGRGATEGICKKIDVSIEEVMGDHEIVPTKENDPDLEGQDTRHLEVQMPNIEPASCGHRTMPKLASMKAGASLTIPPSARISELQDEAEYMHRFKSDPLLQRDAAMKLGYKPAKATELDKTSEEVAQMQQQVSVPSSMTKTGDNIAIENNNISQGFAISDGDHAKTFKTSALLCFQVKQSSVFSDSRARITKENEEDISARDEVSCLVESAIVDALDQIAHEYLVSKCPHKANSLAAAGL